VLGGESSPRLSQSPARSRSSPCPSSSRRRHGFTQEVTELQRAAFGLYPGPYVLAALLLLSVSSRLSRRALVIRRLLVLPSPYLGLLAVRFVFLLAIVGAPLLSRNLDRSRSRRGAASVSAAPPWPSPSRASSRAPRGGPRPRPGAAARGAPQERGTGRGRPVRSRGRSPLSRPIGMTGRLFNAFHFGGYIAWRDLPEARAPLSTGVATCRRVSRGDPFRAGLSRAPRVASSPPTASTAAVMDYPVYSGESLAPDMRLAAHVSGWALVYWDDFALVYLRRSSAWAAVIARDQYRRSGRPTASPALWRSLADKAAVPEIQRELERNSRPDRLGARAHLPRLRAPPGRQDRRGPRRVSGAFEIPNAASTCCRGRRSPGSRRETRRAHRRGLRARRRRAGRTRSRSTGWARP
jgi:hypothetical protein